MGPAAPMEPALNREDRQWVNRNLGLAGKAVGKGGCTGKSKRTHELCGAWAIKGTDKCPAHAGKSRSKAIAEGAVRTEVMAWGLGDVCADPGEVLLRLVTQSAHRAQGYAEELERVVAETPKLRDALIGHIEGEFGPVGEYVRGLVRLEAEERDRCAGMATKAIAAGLAERQVRLAERQGLLMAEVIRLILADLGVADDPRVPQVVSHRLREIVGAA